MLSPFKLRLFGLAFTAWAGWIAAQDAEIPRIPGGLVVHVNCGDGAGTVALRFTDRTLVQGLDRDPAAVARARERFRKLGVLGPVSAGTFDGKHLPYIDNLVNLLVAEDLGDVSVGEVLRVLAPRGTACIGSDGCRRTVTKPWPETIDEWTHYLHGPDNNAVARDTVAGPPRHVQWLGAPRWTRNHHALNSISALVTARGRLFFITDDATCADLNVPSEWFLVARDAFNGVTLWKRRLPTWSWFHNRFRSGPPQLPRLLVASGDRVYLPLGLNEPVSALDASTGATVRTYDSTKGAEEIVLAGETLLVITGAPVSEQAVRHPLFADAYRLPNRKSLVALTAADGTVRWTRTFGRAAPRPETLGSDGERVYAKVGEGVLSLDLRSGKELWTYGRTDAARRRAKVSYGTDVLVVADGVVLCMLERTMTALSADTGAKLWESRGGRGFCAPEDVFVIDGLVWQGFHAKNLAAPAGAADFSAAMNLRTGELARSNRILAELQTAGHHHRCYRNKATTRYLWTAKRGIELMDLAGQEHSRNNWIRGTCQYGIMPANGLVYAPPHSCGCYPESKLWGFWALAASRPVVSRGERIVSAPRRLLKGPAYGKIAGGVHAGAEAEAWPQFRHDSLRSAVSGTSLGKALAPAWTTRLGGRLSAPVAAGGMVLAASVDAGILHAVDAGTGRIAWSHSCGGRIDSPPAVYKTSAIFGCSDGRVYCLRLRDGELVWRFQAAPADLNTVALDRVESLWPVSGSVLLLGGVVYCAAGRSTWLDRGIEIYGLDPATGAVVHSTHFESSHPKFKEGASSASAEQNTKVAQNATDYKTFLAPDRSDSFSMDAGALRDVLVSDGRNVFLHQTAFTASLARLQERRRHLFSISGLLDGAENHRSHWVLGTGDFSRLPVAYSWIINNASRWSRRIAVPAGVIMVFSDSAAWTVQRVGNSTGRYRLVEMANHPFSDAELSLPDFRKTSPGKADKAAKAGKGAKADKAAKATAPRWRVDLAVRPRAMLKAGANLYLGCAPTTASERRGGGTILVIRAEDGRLAGKHPIDSPPVWNGMAAAGGALFVAREDGSIECRR